MRLTSQIRLLLAALLLLALGGAATIHVWITRDALAAQLRLRNDDAATVLALALSQHEGDVGLMQTVAAAQFDTGHYRRVRLWRDDGRLLFERELAPRPGRAPAWFGAWLPQEAAAGSAPVSSGWRPLGRIEVWSQATWADDLLWAGTLQMMQWLGLLGLLGAAAAGVVVRGWRRALDGTVAQARALQDRRFLIADEPRVPEFRRVTRSMNALVHRLQRVFDDQAAELEQLSRQAQSDAVTGLAARRAFVARLDALLRCGALRGAAVLILRVLDLGAMNRRLGHAAADRLLAAIAQVLQSYPQRVCGALVGRLNGSDFALALPARGAAAETADALVQALRAALARVDPLADLRIGGVELDPGIASAAALAAADEALARAETGESFGVVIDAGTAAQAGGEERWERQIAGALDAGRLRLAELAFRRADGTLVHLECAARLRFEPDGAWQPASRWLAPAVRCALIGRVDLTVIELGLQAIARDGRPRAVRLTAASLAAAGFVAEVSRRLQAEPGAARGLWIDVAEAAALRHEDRLREAGAAWRAFGVRLGLERGDQALRGLARLHEIGLDYVKLDRGWLQGLADDAHAQATLRGAVELLRGMRLQVLAEGVDDPALLDRLWSAGIEAAGGQAVAPA